MKSKEQLLAEELEMEEFTPDIPEKKKKKDEELGIQVSFLETEEDIVEQIKYNPIYNTFATRATHTTRTGDNCFLIYNKKTGTILYQTTYTYKNKVYLPIVDELIKENAVLLPTGIVEYGTTKELADELRKFFNEYFEVPKFFEVFLPYLCLFYWVYDKFPFVPYTHFVGRTSTGKSTAMEVFGSVCYKAIDASGSITMASIFRIVTKWRGTLLLDEFDGAGENYHEMLGFLKSGVSNKIVLRTEGEGKKEVKAFMVKSPKLFTSENPINNAGLQSRTIVIKMEKNRRNVPLYRLGGFLAKAEILRNKLLLWRLRHLDKIDLTAIEFGFEELKGFDRRVQQVVTPIFYMSDEESKATIVEFAKEQEKETHRERKEAIDGQIFGIMYELMKEGAEMEMEEIHKRLNAGRGKSNFDPIITEKRIGNVVRKVLGFEIDRYGHDNISKVVMEGREEKVEELCAYYGLSPVPPVSVERVASVAEDDPTHPDFWK